MLLRVLFLIAVSSIFPASSYSQPASTLYVNRTDPTCGGQSPCFATIQAAVNAAQPGNILRIQVGIYIEQVSISGKNNVPGAAETDRIVIESDPGSSPGSVVVDGAVNQCTNGYAFRLQQSKFITLRGFTITGAGGQAISLMGGNNQNEGIHIEQNRIFGNGSSSCDGGITIARGNPGTLIVNNLIYGNGRNGIATIDADGGPHFIFNNTIHANGWNGLRITRSHNVLLVNNLITDNGTASGSTGGRFGVSREGSTNPDPGGIQLLNNVVCGNTGGEITGPALDATDAGNLTPQGAEGPGFGASPGCELPSNIFANVNGADGFPNTVDDDFSLKLGSLAIDIGMDLRALGLDPEYDTMFIADYFRDNVFRPQDGDGDGFARFDAGAFEFFGDFAPPQLVFQNPPEIAHVRQTVSVTVQATDDDAVAALTLQAGAQTLPSAISPALPANSVTGTALWNTTVFSEGTIVLSATATDREGNTARVSRTVIVDNTPPDTQIVSGPTGQIDQTSATFTFAGTDNLTPSNKLVFAWRIDGGGVISFGTDTSATIGGLTVGSHTFEVFARDLAGNVDLTPASRTFTVRLGPVITNVDPSSGSIGTFITITGSEFEPATTQVAFNGAAAVIRTITATTITTTVPTNATTGPLIVSTSRGSASETFAVKPSQDFTLVINPTNVQVAQGKSAAVLIEAIPVGGFSGLIQLTSGSLPAGVNAKLSPSVLTPTNSSQLTLMPTTVTPAGAHLLEIQATTKIDGQTVTRTGTLALNVATPGQTLLVGQVLDGEERPLPGVSIKLGGATLTHLGFSDAAGNIFIPLSVSGPQVFLIDGSTANNLDMYYSTIPITLDIQAGLVNEIGYVPRLRGQPVVKLTPIVPGQATVITDPDLPGFKMTIPAGGQIIGWDGQPNTLFGVTTVPIDRSPLPPLPHGLEARRTYLFSFGKVGGGKPTGNIPIDTANDVGGFPGEKIDLYYFNEAPDGTAPNQWEKYGTGTVSSDGTTIVTDVNPATGLPYGMPRFCCGARTNVRPPNFPTPGGGPSGGSSDSGKRAGDPVDTATGFFYVDKTDMVLAGRIPIVITRTYRTNLNNQGPFGIGTSWPYDVHLASPPDGSGDASILVSAGNRQDYFSRVSFTTFASLTSPALRGAELRVDIRRLRFKDGSFWQFDSTGRLESQTDRNGNVITFSRDNLGRIVRIELFRGGALSISYTDAGIASIADSIGRQVRYSYDALGRLETVTDPSGGVTRYTYDSSHRMLTLTDPRGITFLTNEYDSNGRLARQTQADGGVWTFDYMSSGSFVNQTLVTNPLGQVTTYRFNAAGYQVSETDALGQTTTLERQSGTNLLLSVTDPLKRVTRFDYDGAGNVTRMTDPANNVRTFTYDPTFHKVTSMTDPLGQVTRFEYDSSGKLTSMVDPLGNRRTIHYDSFGQPINTTDPLGNVTAFAYDNNGNLTATTNPLGNSLQKTYDDVSRLTSQTDPRGKTTSFVYDPLNRVTRITNPAGGLTQFSYDANGNLLSVSDARGSVTGYTYDSMDRLATRRDPLGAIESFQYDAMGNLTRRIDRVGQIAAYSYDPLNRRASASYADGASKNLIYDAVGRLTQATDSAGGLIAHQYDNLDRLVAQISNLGTVSYEYDSLDRRTRMNVPGQAPVTYGYDQDSRLRQVVQGINVVDFNYDALGRRTRLSLPNGVSTDYQYDPASRLTSLIYRNAVGVLGDLTYHYDKAGNRTGVGGSFARTLLPDPVPTAAYDAANRQFQFGDKTMAYDANGNMTTISDSSGSTTYSWDARNRLVGLNGPGKTASFIYDVIGRRGATIINGQRVQYLYDGMNPVQETDGAAVLANTLTGLGIDEYFNRADSSGSQQVLSDALGSTVALTDGNGSVQTEYHYEPFGRTTVSGASSANPFQYTGRENDGTGLYYYRARYYHPALQRFVSEDPIGFGGGDVNLYGYVWNNPVIFADTRGLWGTFTHIGMTRTAASDIDGFSQADILQMQLANALSDWSPDVFSETSTRHYMPDSDYSSAEVLIKIKLEEAILRDFLGDRAGAMRALGEGMHTLQDKYSHAYGSPVGTIGQHACSWVRMCQNPDDPNVNEHGYKSAQAATRQYMRDFQRGRKSGPKEFQ
jgi:RHS repeat-associated protein